MFLTNARALYTLIACSMILILINFLDSIISVRLKERFDMAETTIGYIFSIPFFIYVLGCPLISLIGDRLHRRVTILIAFILCAIGVIMTGPSELLHLPE